MVGTGGVGSVVNNGCNSLHKYQNTHHYFFLAHVNQLIADKFCSLPVAMSSPVDVCDHLF